MVRTFVSSLYYTVLSQRVGVHSDDAVSWLLGADFSVEEEGRGGDEGGKGVTPSEDGRRDAVP